MKQHFSNDILNFSNNLASENIKVYKERTFFKIERNLSNNFKENLFIKYKMLVKLIKTVKNMHKFGLSIKNFDMNLFMSQVI